VIVIGFSPDQESLEKIAHGELAGSIFNDSLAQSKNLSDAILAYLRGETVPAQILCDYVKVTADNAQEIMDVSKVQDDDSDEDDGEGDDSEDNDSDDDDGDNE
jgi:methyl-galactoside transport system substrate-binding protein